ncbi:MAG: pyridoxal phosphate-dependent aminotransferase [Alicyclobacillus macrosporangiidus]|uniref:pyridoxal phosphate-dependent aminotransferase n=1 Tax=Alicyclobacillus macrosporangiidus TaxID=392015 RepID=UPI0026E9A65E|nr:pyridoxal phosphate-dependent aminotransferase [Alicyclobacillus macrosporangiidus]MCL6597750.1 pyridoxal phosphate-dependent aminotransferase [Alicyclobacillus macrosporangiidus]
MEQRLSSRVRAIAPSATMSVDAKTKALIREGRPVVNMSVGEPDFDTPVPAAFAGIRAITDGNTRYTPSAGTLDLRRAIAAKLMEENGLLYKPEQIVVSNGAKHSLFNVFLTICDPGDEVILPAPYWVSYPEQIRLSGATPVIVPCDESTGFKITPDQLERAITPRTRAFLLNSPSNPTGAVYSEAELQALGEVLLRHDIYIVADEIYERLVYGVKHVSLAALVPDLMPRTIVVNGFSKAFAMTGWRLGYIAAPLDIAKAVDSLQSHSTGSPSTISQAAGVAALRSFEPQMVAEFERRRNRLVQGLRELPGVECLIPDGAFYVFPNVSKLLTARWDGQVIGTATRLCELLLEQELVATVPGEAFGAPNNIRLSYATAYENIETAIERMHRFVQRLL